MNKKRLSLFKLIFILLQFLFLGVVIILNNVIFAPISQLSGIFQNGEAFVLCRCVNDMFNGTVKVFNFAVACGTLAVIFFATLITLFVIRLLLSYVIKPILSVLFTRERATDIDNGNESEVFAFQFSATANKEFIQQKSTKLSM